MKLIISCCLLFGISTVVGDYQDSLKNCFQKDSISCIQLSIFRQAKSFFDKPKIDLFGGISLIKNDEEVSRQGKSIADNTIAVEEAPSVEARNGEMETYFWNEIVSFLQQRSLSFNFANAARSISNSIPDEVKSDIKGVVEGRLSRRRIMRKLMPFIMGLAAKLVLLKVAALFGILFIAKKALVISVIALAMSIFGGAGSLLSGAGGGGYSGGSGGGIFSSLGGLFGGGKNNIGGSVGGGDYASGGWSSGGGGGGWDSAGAYSSPVGQSIAYSGYKQNRR